MITLVKPIIYRKLAERSYRPFVWPADTQEVKTLPSTKDY